jgi:GntR family transcriptional regulator
MHSSPSLTRSLRPDGRPLYAQAMDALQQLLASGEYQAGEALPSEESLAKQLGISRSTLREAMSFLEKDGLICRRQGVGTFVAPRPQADFLGGLERLESVRSQAQQAGLTVATRARSVSTVPASSLAATALGCVVQAPLTRIEVLEEVAGAPMAYLDGYCLPGALSENDARCGQGSLLECLELAGSTRPQFTRSNLFAINASSELALRLELPTGSALLHLAEVFYDELEKPVAFNNNYFVTWRANYHILRRVVRGADHGGNGR